MLLTRRGFVGSLGLGTAATVLTGTSLLSGLASAQTREAAMKGVFDGGIMQLNQRKCPRPRPKYNEGHA